MAKVSDEPAYERILMDWHKPGASIDIPPNVKALSEITACAMLHAAMSTGRRAAIKPTKMIVTAPPAAIWRMLRRWHKPAPRYTPPSGAYHRWAVRHGIRADDGA